MNNNRFYKIGIGICIALITLVAIFFVKAKNKDNQIAQENESSIMSSTNLVEDSSITIDTKGDDFNEIEESTENKNQNTNTSENKSEKTSNEQKKQSTPKSDSTTTQKNVETKQQEKDVQKEEVKKDPTFKYPVKGEIMQDYAKDKLVYSSTLGEWITHAGIDIKADKTTVVTASADGCVKSIKNDPRYGLTIVIEHTNGFYTVYSNLLTAEFVSVGENVKSGQTIGTVGNTAAFEILDEPHLHFEILKESEAVDPNMYLKN